MKKEEITVKEALRIVSKYPTLDSYVLTFYRQRFLPGFGMDDNSIELASHYNACERKLGMVASNWI